MKGKMQTHCQKETKRGHVCTHHGDSKEVFHGCLQLILGDTVSTLRSIHREESWTVEKLVFRKKKNRKKITGNKFCKEKYSHSNSTLNYTCHTSTNESIPDTGAHNCSHRQRITQKHTFGLVQEIGTLQKGNPAAQLVL